MVISIPRSSPVKLHRLQARSSPVNFTGIPRFLVPVNSSGIVLRT
jgi:hypothetical protein